MNWLTRYVAEVKRYLSRKGSDDIGDELESLLEDKIDARAECLGRGLTEDEVLALLKESGHPLKVAAGYNDSRPLISAILFPFYIKVIQNLILAASAVYLLSVIWVNLMGDYIEWPGFNFGTVWNFTVNWLVFITLGFFLAERYRLNQQFFEDWGPRELPSAGTQREEFATSISICIAIIIWLALLNLLSSDYSWAALSGQAENPVSIFTFWLKVQAVVVWQCTWRFCSGPAGPAASEARSCFPMPPSRLVSASVSRPARRILPGFIRRCRRKQLSLSPRFSICGWRVS